MIVFLKIELITNIVHVVIVQVHSPRYQYFESAFTTHVENFRVHFSWDRVSIKKTQNVGNLHGTEKA